MVDRKGKPPALSASPSEPQPHVDISPDNARVTARLPSGDAVEILLHGATVISWTSDGQENLWLSEKAVLDGSKAVRGGIPVVFPVFGPPPPNHATSALPQHGFARTSRWEFLGKSTSEALNTSSSSLPSSSSHPTSGSTSSSPSVKLDFGLYTTTLSPAARTAWPHDFSLVYSVTLGRGTLETMLNVRNEGREAFDFQVLLHSYFRVADISRTELTGLLGVPYVDKVLDGRTHTEESALLRISGEMDRLYGPVPQSTTGVLVDGRTRFEVVRDRLEDAVVWNPWREKAGAMGDFAPKEGYKQMVCVEVGAVRGWQRLEGADSWEGGQVVRAFV